MLLGSEMIFRVSGSCSSTGEMNMNGWSSTRRLYRHLEDRASLLASGTERLVIRR